MVIDIFEFTNEVVEFVFVNSWMKIFRWSLISIAVILFAYFIYKAFETPKLITFEEDWDLKFENYKKLASEKKLKEVYFGLVMLFKALFKQYLQMDIDSKTEEEILSLISKKHFEKSFVLEVMGFLERAFQIRFAAQEVLDATIEQDFLWLENTKKHLLAASLVSRTVTKK